ncbi:hypothetical protein HS5_15820 [Acidianus sp. HS-5]|nr:hypothetical protein HS5_15820 [Acidianus sp. HS-5]
MSGFSISTIFSVVLPFNFIDPILHNTYYVAGSFHSIIWDFLITGFFLGFYMFVSTFEVKKIVKEHLLKASILTWLISSTILSYIMMVAGYEGLIRREVVFSQKFLVLMDLMSTFAFIAVFGIGLAFSIEISKLIMSIKIKKVKGKKIMKVVEKLRRNF